MGLLKQLFTWWDGATLTTCFVTCASTAARSAATARAIVYYASKKGDRRFVIYDGRQRPQPHPARMVCLAPPP